MQLTEIQRLNQDYTNNDVVELVAVMQSTVLSSPSSEIRYKDVRPSDMQSWMKQGCLASYSDEFQIPRITDMPEGTEIPYTPYAEHLVIRDLDLDHLETEEPDDIPGHIVAHADYRFTPASDTATASLGGGINSTDATARFPDGLHRELYLLINTRVEAGIAKVFGGLPAFTLYGISTLQPSHLRKGIAKRLTEWVYPYADRLALPVVLAASPAGLYLYRSCGFVEYREHDVLVDLGRFGRVGEVHCHVMMVRWPADGGVERLPGVWREWRERHGEGEVGRV